MRERLKYFKLPLLIYIVYYYANFFKGFCQIFLNFQQISRFFSQFALSMLTYNDQPTSSSAFLAFTTALDATEYSVTPRMVSPSI